ncbi:Rust resistance kinase Lr10, partial [Mucuna pruriens]
AKAEIAFGIGIVNNCSELSRGELATVGIPESVKLILTNIDYKQQIIRLTDPMVCLTREVLNLNLSASRFQFRINYYVKRLSRSVSIANQKGTRGWKNDTAKHEVHCFAGHEGLSIAPMNTGQTSISDLLSASILGLLYLILLIGAVYYIYDSYNLQKLSLKPIKYSYAEIKRIANNFEDKLGEGAYGTVFRGRISKEVTIVVVKILNNSQGKWGRVHQ